MNTIDHPFLLDISAFDNEISDEELSFNEFLNNSDNDTPQKGSSKIFEKDHTLKKLLSWNIDETKKLPLRSNKTPEKLDSENTDPQKQIDSPSIGNLPLSERFFSTDYFKDSPLQEKTEGLTKALLISPPQPRKIFGKGVLAKKKTQSLQNSSNLQDLLLSPTRSEKSQNISKDSLLNSPENIQNISKNSLLNSPKNIQNISKDSLLNSPKNIQNISKDSLLNSPKNIQNISKYSLLNSPEIMRTDVSSPKQQFLAKSSNFFQISNFNQRHPLLSDEEDPTELLKQVEILKKERNEQNILIENQKKEILNLSEEAKRKNQIQNQLNQVKILLQNSEILVEKEKRKTVEIQKLYSQSEQSLEIKKNELFDFQNDFNSLKEKYQNLLQTFKSLDIEHSTLKFNSEQFSKKIKTHQNEEKEELLKKISKLEKEVFLKSKFVEISEKLEEEKNSLLKKLEKVQKEKRNSSTQDIEKLKEKLNSANEQKKEQEKQIETLKKISKEALENNKQTVSELEQQGKFKDLKIKEKTEESTNLKEELKKIALNNKKIRKEAQKKLNEGKELNESLQRKLEISNKELEILKKEISFFKKEENQNQNHNENNKFNCLEKENSFLKNQKSLSSENQTSNCRQTRKLLFDKLN